LTHFIGVPRSRPKPRPALELVRPSTSAQRLCRRCEKPLPPGKATGRPATYHVECKRAERRDRAVASYHARKPKPRITGFAVYVGGERIRCATWAELEAIVRRYGGVP
jgi:hypothetical protein